MGFVANFIRFPAVQNFENRLRFDKVTQSSKVGTFLRHSVYMTDRLTTEQEAYRPTHCNHCAHQNSDVHSRSADAITSEVANRPILYSAWIVSHCGRLHVGGRYDLWTISSSSMHTCSAFYNSGVYIIQVGEITEMPKSFLITNKRYVTGSSSSSSSSSSRLSATSPHHRDTTTYNEEEHMTSTTCTGIDEETG